MTVRVVGRKVYCNVYAHWFSVDAKVHITGVPINGLVKIVCDTVLFCGHFEFQVFINIIHEVVCSSIFFLIKYYQYIFNIPFIVGYFLVF